MPIDESKIGVTAANLMEQIAATYGDEADLEAVLVIAAVDHGEQSTIHYAASPGLSHHVGRGMLLVVQDALAGRHPS